MYNYRCLCLNSYKDITGKTAAIEPGKKLIPVILYFYYYGFYVQKEGEKL